MGRGKIVQMGVLAAALLSALPVGGELLNYVASAILCVTTSVVPFNACEKYFSSSFTC